jgi:hypothetical protein
MPAAMSRSHILVTMPLAWRLACCLTFEGLAASNGLDHEYHRIQGWSDDAE